MQTESCYKTAIFDVTQEIFYDILIWIYDNHKTLNDESLRVSLLKGLSDESEAINTKLFEFWDHETRLSTKTFTRLNQIFRYAKLLSVYCSAYTHVCICVVNYIPGRWRVNG